MENNRMINQEQMLHPDYSQQLRDILRSNKTPKAFQQQLSGYHENDIAAALEQLTPQERKQVFQMLNVDTLAEVLPYVDAEDHFLGELSLRKRVDVLGKMDADLAVDYLKLLSSEEKNTIVELMDEEKRQELSRLWAYSEDEIGSVMTTNFIAIPADLSVKEAMHSLIAQAADNDNISTIYVSAQDGTFYGAIDLQDLIVAREGTALESIITTSYPYLYAQERIEDCIPRIQDYSEDSIPVLDQDNRLLGVITAQDFMQVVDDELSDDYAKLAGLASEEDLKEPLTQSIRKRLPWLMVLLGLGLVVSSVVGLFEAVVAQITLIVCFQSLVLDMAGNVGTQSLAVTIRVLMDSSLEGHQKAKLVWKESKVGLANGLILGVASFVLIGLYLWLLKGQAVTLSFAISACIGLALVLSMLLSSITGTVIPIFFKAIKVDPAVASGPLITTVNDLVAVVTYYGLAWLLLIEVFRLV